MANFITTYRIPNFFGIESSDIDDAKEEYDFKEVNKVIEKDKLYAVQSEGELRSINEDLRIASDTNRTLSEDLDTLNNIKDVIKDQTDITSTTSTLVEMAVESIYKRHGLIYRKPSIEKYNKKDSIKTINIAIEGIGEFLSKMWREFWEFIKSIFGFGSSGSKKGLAKQWNKCGISLKEKEDYFNKMLKEHKDLFVSDVPEEKLKEVTKTDGVSACFAMYAKEGEDYGVTASDLIGLCKDLIPSLKKASQGLDIKKVLRNQDVLEYLHEFSKDSDGSKVDMNQFREQFSKAQQSILKQMGYTESKGIFTSADSIRPQGGDVKNMPSSVYLSKSFTESEARSLFSILKDILKTYNDYKKAFDSLDKESSSEAVISSIVSNQEDPKKMGSIVIKLLTFEIQLMIRNLSKVIRLVDWASTCIVKQIKNTEIDGGLLFATERGIESFSDMIAFNIKKKQRS